jgi:hypothetical protein
MSDNKDRSEADKGVGEDEKSFFKIIIHSFFIIPFLIAVFCVLLFTGIHLLTREQRSVYDYLEDIKTGGQTKRWQGAFELSRILANQDLIPKEARFTLELISAFEQAKHDDARTRQYIALAMGRTGKPDFVLPLINGLSEEKEENIPAIIYALGMLKQKQAAPAIYRYAEHSDSRIRSIAIVALGNIADPESKNILKKHLNDPEPNVQWGAAVSLAQMDDPSGKAILSQMLNRQYWTQFPAVDRDEQNSLVLTAIHASKMLNDLELNAQIKQIAQTDTNMKVRAAALESLK